VTRARVSSKGQVVIPAHIRRKFGIRKGTILLIEERDDGIVMRPLTAAYFDRFAGILKGEDSLTEALLEERAREKAREDEEWR